MRFRIFGLLAAWPLAGCLSGDSRPPSADPPSLSLTFVQALPVGTGARIELIESAGPDHLLVYPGGYGGDTALNRIRVYRRDYTGRLFRIPQAEDPERFRPILAVGAGGTRIYSGSDRQRRVESFAFQAGQLAYSDGSQESPDTTSGWTTSLAIHPNGRILYAASVSGGREALDMYNLNPATGKPDWSGSYETESLFGGALAISSDGRNLYGATSSDTDGMAIMRLDDSGDVEALSFFPWSPKGVAALAIRGDRIFLARAGGGLEIWRLDPVDGDLRERLGVVVTPRGELPCLLHSGRLDIAVDSAGHRVVMSGDQSRQIAVFARAGDVWRLAECFDASGAAEGFMPRLVDLSPDGRHLHVAGMDVVATYRFE